MSKQALVSKHLVLCEHNGEFPRYPLAGIILILDETIIDIIVSKDDFEYMSLFCTYSDWSPVDYSDYYISPGLIDLNVRAEWDQLSTLTQSAISGGVTLALIESGHYKQIDPNDTLYCDIGKVEVVNESSVFENINQSVMVLKSYLFPPAAQVKSVSHLEHLIHKVQRLDVPFFMDATLPDPRMLYMASPMRLENIEERKSTGKKEFSMFVSAFPQEEQISSKESESSEGESPPVLRAGSLKSEDGAETSFKNFRLNNELHKSDRKMSLAFPSTPLKLVQKEKKSQVLSIYDDLDMRIKNSLANYEDLINVEASTYTLAGNTSYEPPKKTMSLSDISILGQNSNLPTSASTSFMSKLSMRAQSFQLKPLETKTIKIDNLNDYTHHLANYPVHWETSGISKVLEHVPDHFQIHFVGISSASAVNSIRNARKRFKNITCEISSVNLCFTSACIKPGDTRFKNSPPVRNSANCNLLWDLLKMKGIDIISSAHAFINPSKKLTQNFQTALNGIASIGCSLQSVWYILNKPVSSNDQLEHYVVRMAKWMSLHPAQVLSISQTRGSIQKGKKADFVVWSPKEKYKIDREYFYSELSPFFNHEVMGKIKIVYLRGKIAWNGTVTEPFGEQIYRNI